MRGVDLSTDWYVGVASSMEDYLEHPNVSLEGSLHGCRLSMLGIQLFPELVA